MLKEGVRQDRTRGGRQKYYRKHHVQAASSVSQTSHDAILDGMKKIEGEESPIMAVCPYTGRILAQAELSQSTTTFTAAKVWNIIADLYNKQIEANVIPIKILPGLNELTIDDQMALFRGGWSEILTLSLVYQSRDTVNGERCLKFAPNFFIRELVANLCGMEQFFDKVRSKEIMSFSCYEVQGCVIWHSRKFLKWQITQPCTS